MRALRTQIYLLLALCALGVITWMIDYQQDLGGDWFVRFGITQLVWLAIGIYALASSILVLLVWILFKIKAWPYTGGGVLLTHGIGIGLVFIMLSLGVHDVIDDAFKGGRQLQPTEMQQLQQSVPAPRPAISPPPSPPRSKVLPQAPEGIAPQLPIEEHTPRPDD